MAKKSFNSAASLLVSELGDCHSGYFNHSHFIANESKAFVKAFDSKTNDSGLRPLKHACQLSSETIMASDTFREVSGGLEETSASLKSSLTLLKAALSKEPEHIQRRLKTREEREPYQDKEMTAFLAMQEDEKSQIDADFEAKRSELALSLESI